MYLSTECKEPCEKKNQKAVDRMHKFKFHAEKKARYFEIDDICYITMDSTMGCTIRITAGSNKIRALAAPEKVKEFNKAMTNAEIAAEEKNAVKKELYIQGLEEKYDDLLKDFLSKEKKVKNMKKEHVQTVGFYNTAKAMEREMGKNRRYVLSKVAKLYQQEKEEFL